MTGIRRALAPVLLVAAALAFAFAFERALACPVQMPPQPLRTLYKVSERVVVARVRAREVVKVYDGTEVASVRIALHVTENVKGAPAELLHLRHDEYIGKDAEEEPVDEQVSVFSGRTIPTLKRGERYLFFLEPLEEGGVYGVNDESYGIKQLSDDDLKVYLERLKELAEMTRRGAEDKHALVEWLVRCAEQPATRWEGAFELLESAWTAAAAGAAPAEEQGEAGAEAPDAEEASDAQTSGEAQAAPQPQESDAPADAAEADPSAEATEQPSGLPASEDIRYAGPDPELASLLNAVQKQRLTDAFFATDVPKQGDDELMLLVKDFGDARFAAFILARLHRFEEDPPAGAEFWLRTLADSLKNEQIIRLADTYTQEATYHEEEETEAAAAPETPAPAEAVGEEEAAAEEKQAAVDPEVEAAREAAAAERARVKRSAMLKAVLARIDLFVAAGQLAGARP